MPRRKRPADTKRLRKRGKGDDPFNRVNDDIIQFHILSRLSLEEAARTSVLSHRWRKLWTGSIGPKLIFSWSRERFCYDDMTSKIRHVLEVVKPTFNELTINFDYWLNDSEMIDGWVKSALRQRVTRLELDFTPFNEVCGKGPRFYYNFPGMDKLSAWHAICGNHHLHERGLYNLTDVCLKYVNVSVEVIDCMLSKCPSLERFSLWKSCPEKKDKVSIQSSKLKSLGFVKCKYKKIEICAPNLVSLQYNGKKKGLCLAHVPLLSELSIAGDYCVDCFERDAPKFSYLSQLRRLTLDIKPEDMAALMDYPLEFPQLVRLEHLEIILQPCCDTSLLWIIILIKAAPFLHKFTIWEGYGKSLLNIIEQVDHQWLKLIEMRKFIGSPFQMEFGRHLLGISQSLEQVVVWPRVNDKPNHMSKSDFEVTQEYCKKAQQLNRWLPASAKLVVDLPEIFI
ncbi:hypothetical protein RDABS01_012638 [Bienertia sinuspersici]